MQETDIIIIASVIGSLIVGFLIAWFVFMRAAKTKNALAADRAKTILKEAEIQAEATKNSRILEAKEKFLQLKAEHEKSISEKNRNIAQAEQRIKQKEQTASQRMEQTQRRQTELDALQQRLKGQIEGVERRPERGGFR